MPVTAPQSSSFFERLERTLKEADDAWIVTVKPPARAWAEYAYLLEEPAPAVDGEIMALLASAPAGVKPRRWLFSPRRGTGFYVGVRYRLPDRCGHWMLASRGAVAVGRLSDVVWGSAQARFYVDRDRRLERTLLELLAQGPEQDRQLRRVLGSGGVKPGSERRRNRRGH